MKCAKGALVGLATLLAAWGCGGEAKPVVETAASYAKVAGKVTIKGKPARQGRVTFDLANASPLAGSARSTDIKTDGSYEISAPVGNNSVIIVGTGNPVADASYNTTSFDVKQGDNTLDLDLPIKE